MNNVALNLRPKLVFLLIAVNGLSYGQLLSIALPERTRLLEDQRVDLVIEARNVTGGTLTVTANGADLTSCSPARAS